MHTRMMMVLAAAIVAAGSVRAVDTLAARAAKIEEGLRASIAAVDQQAQKLAAIMQAHGMQSPEVAEVQASLQALGSGQAWRDLRSRTTKVRENAQKGIEDKTEQARNRLQAPARQLDVILAAEEARWAAANPAAAGILAAQRMAQNADFAAQTAAEEARKASYEAAEARKRADEAQYQAAESERRAKQAERTARYGW